MTGHAASWPSRAPAEAPPLEAGDVHLWLFDLDAAVQTLPDPEGLLDAGERNRAARFVQARDANRYRRAHGQLRRLLASYQQADPASLRFAIGHAGKPALQHDATGPALHFNLAHSGSHGLVGVSRSAPIGVDIECVRPLPERLQIADANFAPTEREALRGLPDAMQEDGFFACWTRKEAFVKALGDGLSMPLEAFEVSVDPTTPARLICINQDSQAARAWTMWAERPLPGVWAAAAAPVRSAQFHTFVLR